MAFVSGSILGYAARTVTSILVPPGSAAGQIAVVDLWVQWTSGTVTPPEGFTLHQSVTFTGSTRFATIYRYWKRLTGVDDFGHYTFTTAATSTMATCSLWSGRKTTGSPFDTGTGASTTVSAPSGTNTNVACPEVPSLTPTVAGADLLYGVSLWSGGLVSNTVTAGWTVGVRNGAAGMLQAHKENQPATASGTVSTSGSNNWAAILSALLPGPVQTQPTAHLSGMDPIMDSEVTVDVTSAANGLEQRAYVGLRTNGVFTSQGQPDRGYFLNLFGSSSTFQVIRNVGGVSTVLATPSLTRQAGVPLHVKFRLEGPDVYAKVWYGATEPGSWTWSGFDATPYLTAGKASLSASNAATPVGAQQVLFDNLAVWKSTKWNTAAVWSGTPGVLLQITEPGRYNGGGQTVAGIEVVNVNDVIIENFVVSGADSTGIWVWGNNITIQDCEITQVLLTTEDLDAIRFFGNNIRIFRNYVHDLAGNDPGDSHMDFAQTWTTSRPGAEGLMLAGNRVFDVDDQALMAEGPGSTDGGGGGTGICQNWLVEDNYFSNESNQSLALRDIHNVVVRNNTFLGAGNKAVQITDGTDGVTYDSNILGPDRFNLYGA